jgi:cytochrome oxidase assembly protein ShyY1
MRHVLLRPRWFIAHVVVLAVATLFVVLGFWQLSRHAERQAHNDLVEARMAEEETTASDALGEGDAAYRRVSVSGRFVPDEELLLTPRSWQGRAGHHVLTPLATDGGAAVLVDRGWVPFEEDDPPVAAAAPDAGDVTVEGLLMPDEPQRRFAPAIPPGHVDSVSRVDLERIQEQVSVPLHRGYYLQVVSQGGNPPPELPLPANPPELGEGNHLSYAFQWWLFALVGLVGYPLLLRRTIRDTTDGPPDGADPPGRDAGPATAPASAG